MQESGRDRLRELLDAVLQGTAGADSRGSQARKGLGDLAAAAASSPYHFNRLVSADTGEPPVRMRRRVLLERSAWQLRQGASVTETAWEAGYESVEGFARAFSRAFGRPPSGAGDGYWLPSPNGIHFHPPTSLWVSAEEQPMSPLTEQMVSHDLDDTRALLEQAKGLTDDEFRAVLAPGTQVLSWDGPEESIAAVLANQVLAKDVWLAAIEGSDLPVRDSDATAAALIERHDAVAPRWLAMVRDLDRRGGWNDRLVDALCDPPESFVMSSVIAHVLTYSAHRRQLVRRLFAQIGHDVDNGDPIMWLRARYGQENQETGTGVDRG
jgi:AraC family transcriptional regulator